jgi:hypothetical protein
MKTAGRRHGTGWGRVAILALALLPTPVRAGDDTAPAAASPTVADGDYKASPKIPKRLLRQVLGCWQLDGQERWVITRLDLSGAQVVTKALRGKAHPPFPDRTRRVAVPATLMYDARQGNFGFASAGRHRPTLVVFKASDTSLAASLYAKRSSKERYAPTGDTATLDRCKVRKRPGRTPRRQQTPPRLE